MEFMSCSSTQGHCRTQTYHRDFLRFFIWSSTHNVLCGPPAYLLHMAEMPGSFGSLTYYLWAEPGRLESNVQQNETCWPKLQHGQPLSRSSQQDKQQAEDEISDEMNKAKGSEATEWQIYACTVTIYGSRYGEYNSPSASRLLSADRTDTELQTHFAHNKYVGGR